VEEKELEEGGGKEEEAEVEVGDHEKKAGVGVFGEGEREWSVGEQEGYIYGSDKTGEGQDQEDIVVDSC
jgi:hypothetical protein